MNSQETFTDSEGLKFNAQQAESVCARVCLTRGQMRWLLKCYDSIPFFYTWLSPDGREIVCKPAENKKQALWIACITEIT